MHRINNDPVRISVLLDQNVSQDSDLTLEAGGEDLCGRGAARTMLLCVG